MSERVRTIPTLDRPLSPESGVVPPNLAARPLTKDDYDHVVQVVDHWWDGPIAVLAHPMFFYEFGKYARVVEDVAAGGKLVGFLLGFMLPAEADTHPLGYIHLVGIDPGYRRKGVARALYNEFASTCANLGCTRLKAVTTVGNEGSLRFHQALGWSAVEDKDYAGPGRRRVVLTKGA
ncbi:MAG: GNAT family N-acetyltransferase [Polyangiales bacterium]